jgi:hypothetical protein
MRIQIYTDLGKQGNTEMLEKKRKSKRKDSRSEHEGCHVSLE